VKKTQRYPIANRPGLERDGALTEGQLGARVDALKKKPQRARGRGGNFFFIERRAPGGEEDKRRGGSGIYEKILRDRSKDGSDRGSS